MTPVRGTARKAGMVTSSLTRRRYHSQEVSARQAPPAQVSLLAQTCPQAPQLNRSTFRSVQEPEQLVSPDSQADSQPARPQTCPAAQAFPHPPQLWNESTQAPLQTMLSHCCRQISC